MIAFRRYQRLLGKALDAIAQFTLALVAALVLIAVPIAVGMAARKLPEVLWVVLGVLLIANAIWRGLRWLR